MHSHHSDVYQISLACLHEVDGDVISAPCVPIFNLKHHCYERSEVCRVHTHFSRSNSSTFQALLMVIFNFVQHPIAGIKYISTGIYLLMFIFFHFFSQLCTLYYAVNI